jgi:hypothetical protein
MRKEFLAMDSSGDGSGPPGATPALNIGFLVLPGVSIFKEFCVCREFESAMLDLMAEDVSKKATETVSKKWSDVVQGN